MSIPEGQIINTAYFDSVIARIEGCGTCDTIQAALDDATGSVTAQLGSLTEKLAVLQPYIALATAPGANPAQLATWITDLIAAQIEPMLKPVITIPLQMAELAMLPAKFAAAAAAAQARLPSCSITPPTFDAPVVPKAILDYAALKNNGIE